MCWISGSTIPTTTTIEVAPVQNEWVPKWAQFSPSPGSYCQKLAFGQKRIVTMAKHCVSAMSLDPQVLAGGLEWTKFWLHTRAKASSRPLLPLIHVGNSAHNSNANPRPQEPIQSDGSKTDFPTPWCSVNWCPTQNGTILILFDHSFKSI